MRSIAVALPLNDTQGAIDAVERMLRDSSDGLHENRLRHGLQRLKIFIQQRPQAMAIFYLEGDDVEASMVKRHSEDDELEQAIDEAVHALTGHYFRDVWKEGAPAELVFDWHEERGPSRSEHAPA
jgi:hypothetical protein